MPSNLENSAEATGLEKVSFHSNPKERQYQRMLKLLHNCSYLHTGKVMLKILQVRLQQYMNHELPDVQAGFRKGIKIRDQIANIYWNSLAFLMIQWMLAILISGSSAFSKSSLNIWKLMVHVLLMPGLENFEYYLASM